MAKTDFTDLIKGRLDSLLGEVGYRYTESVYDGYFDNCQVVYSSGKLCLCFLRDRGSVRVGFGFRVNNYVLRSWPLHVVIEYWGADARYRTLASQMLQELDDCDVVSDKFAQLLKECMPKVQGFLLHSDLSIVDKELSQLSKTISDRNIENIIQRSHPHQERAKDVRP